MNETLKNLLVTLSILQRVDKARAKLARTLEGVEQRIEALDEQLVAFQKEVENGQTKLEELNKQYRSDENEVKDVEAKIVRSNEKLLSVKTNKEYNSILKEIDEMTEKRSAIEDRMLEALDAIEEAKQQAKSLQADLADLQQEIEDKRNSIRAEADAQSKEMEALTQEREELWGELDTKMQTMYNRTLQQCNGIAVAAVIDATCQECRMNIPPQAYIELMRVNSMSMCPHCQRIIYPKSVIEGEPVSE